MSVTESKAKATRKASVRKITPAEQDAIKVTLDAAPVEYVALTVAGLTQ